MSDFYDFPESSVDYLKNFTSVLITAIIEEGKNKKKIPLFYSEKSIFMFSYEKGFMFQKKTSM